MDTIPHMDIRNLLVCGAKSFVTLGILHITNPPHKKSLSELLKHAKIQVFGIKMLRKIIELKTCEI